MFYFYLIWRETNVCVFKILIKMGVFSKYKDITVIPSMESKIFCTEQAT